MRLLITPAFVLILCALLFIRPGVSTLVDPTKHPLQSTFRLPRQCFQYILLLALLTTLNGCPRKTSVTVDPKKNGGQGAPSQSLFQEILVPEGSFDMGSEYGESDEAPIHRVQVKAFYIDKYEVTNKQYRAFLAAIKEGGGGNRVLHEDCPKDKDHRPSPPKINDITFRFPKDYWSNTKYDNYPVVGIDWYDAYTFAAWAGRRLASEAEWEYAARSVENREFPWGSERPLKPKARANYYTPIPPGKDSRRLRKRRDKFGTTAVFDHADGFPFVAPVGSFPNGSARCGAMDMAGNVWEWTGSSYAPYGKKAPKLTQVLRVLRGGAWDSPSSFLFRGSNRVSCKPHVRRCSIGFRTARSLKEGEK
jgi:formylglycine-generating enzyme required for sulfatase activity